MSDVSQLITLGIGPGSAIKWLVTMGLGIGSVPTNPLHRDAEDILTAETITAQLREASDYFQDGAGAAYLRDAEDILTAETISAPLRESEDIL